MFTHLAFSDESCYNEKRFRSLSMVTIEKSLKEKIESFIQKIYTESNVSILEWKEIEIAKDRLCAKKVLDYLFPFLLQGNMKIDIIIWDIEDTRHKINKRDDIENLKRMYYHLMRNTFKNRWNDSHKWMIIPDEFTAFDWSSIQNIISTQQYQYEFIDEDLFTDNNGFPFILKNCFHIYDLQEGKSKEEIFLQIADLFAGMGAFSHKNYDKYGVWLLEKDSLFLVNTDKVYSKRDIERFHVIHHFDNLCKKNKLQVSLKTEKGFVSKNIDKPINFWKYEPQHELDKAPVREYRKG
jgi:hypothetical protein